MADVLGDDEVKSSLLQKLKNSVVGEEEKIDIDGVDLDSGTIIIEESGPQEIVSTGAVLREGFDHETDIFFKGFTGTVFVLDLNPFFAAIGTTSNSRIGESLIAFAETNLSRELQGIGSFKNYSNEQFFFRLNKDDAEGWVMAAKAVNAIGEHFLRDSYEADDMISELLASVDINDLKGENGVFDGAKAMANKVAVKSVEDAIQKSEELLWEKLDAGGVKRSTNTEWETETKDMREALNKVDRGPERRQREIKAPAHMERRKTTGRRDIDNPNKSVW
jgi:hypothetical protein